MDVALIGFAGCGKTTLLRALAAGHLPQHPNPHEPAVAVVKVPDERLEQLAAMVQARKTTHLELRLLDFPSLSAGRKGPPPQLLNQLATADLLVHVVRAFGADADPAREVEALETELALADLAIVERRGERLKAEVRSLPAGARGAQERELALLRRLQEALEAGKPIRSLGLTDAERAPLAGFNLLTAKPKLTVLNIDEAEAAHSEEIEARARARFGGPGSSVIALAAKAEADVAELPAEEAAAFRRELGLPETPAAARLLQETVSLLGLITFYTVAPQDTHAWSVPAGTSAVKAAGRVHSDIERGFIRAEVIGWRELLEAGSQAEAKRRGLVRLEGKGYEVQDGDVINVLFSV